ncbi:hypothetical protein ACFV98_06060 [Streptomyces violascens]
MDPVEGLGDLAFAEMSGGKADRGLDLTLAEAGPRDMSNEAR